MQKIFWLSQRQIVLPLEETNLSWKQQLPFARRIFIFQSWSISFTGNGELDRSRSVDL